MGQTLRAFLEWDRRIWRSGGSFNDRTG